MLAQVLPLPECLLLAASLVQFLHVERLSSILFPRSATGEQVGGAPPPHLQPGLARRVYPRMRYGRTLHTAGMTCHSAPCVRTVKPPTVCTFSGDRGGVARCREREVWSQAVGVHAITHTGVIAGNTFVAPQVSSSVKARMMLHSPHGLAVSDVPCSAGRHPVSAL